MSEYFPEPKSLGGIHTSFARFKIVTFKKCNWN